MCVTLKWKNRGSLEKDLKHEGSQWEQKRQQPWDEKKKQMYMKFLNVENCLSAPIFPVWNQKQGH